MTSSFSFISVEVSGPRLRLCAAIAALLVLSLSTPSGAFVSPHRATALHDTVRSNILLIRGGDINAPPSTSSSSLSSAVAPLVEALVSGTPLQSMGAMYAVAALTVVPLTWYSFPYSFSVGYGLSVTAMSMALLASFSSPTVTAPVILAWTSLAYGVRLATYIFLRERTVDSKREQFAEMNSGKSMLSRIPLALGVSLLYTLMVSPVLFAFRGTPAAPGTLSDSMQKFFTCVAIFGVILETAADQQKYIVKGKSAGGEDKFVGPTSGSYRFIRHPNYLGEILHWIGIFGAGSVSFGRSATAWIAGILGVGGILNIMVMATAGLDKKQTEKYTGQPLYDDWKGKTNSLVPFLK